MSRLLRRKQSSSNHQVDNTEPKPVEAAKSPMLPKVLLIMARVLGKVVLALFVLLYVAVAVLNYAPVQTILGSVASSKISEQWGGKFKVGSLNVNLFNHLSLRDVEIIAPGNDTIVVAGHVGCQFNHFPLQRDKDNRYRVTSRLEVNYVNVDDTYYHFHNYEDGTNINNFVSILAAEVTRSQSATVLWLALGGSTCATCVTAKTSTSRDSARSTTGW